MFWKALTYGGHIRTFKVDAVRSQGWEVRVVEDSTVVRQTCYSDWHRVERAISAIEREVSALEAKGWRPTPDVAQSSA